MTTRPALPLIILLALALALGGCEGVQSVIAPEGPQAARIALLFWVLTAGGTVILVGVIVLTAMAMSGRRPPEHWLSGEPLVIGGGLVFPIVLLTALLGYGLFVMRADTAPAAAGDALRIAVVGERWWWRVTYRDDSGARFESANEIRIPVGRTVALELTSADVIHSFWVPKLAGKLDMIPGRTNVLTLSADRPGVSRGQCAEYCGGAHALMSFHVVAMPPQDFEAWQQREAGPAQEPQRPIEREGMLLFISHGCGACHAIRGTTASGTIGPDLTHVGSRRSLAAATLPNDTEAIARWIADNQHIKPGNLMPPFRIFSEDELAALAAYLASLR
jgi:cytochrome c oxidase subunit 2